MQRQGIRNVLDIAQQSVVDYTGLATTNVNVKVHLAHRTEFSERRLHLQDVASGRNVFPMEDDTGYAVIQEQNLKIKSFFFFKSWE
jgi:hypothetical protein